MVTRWQVDERNQTLTPEDFIYLQDGPRQGDTLLAPNHTGKIVVSPVPNGVPRLGAELVYQPTTTKTSEGARCYRLCVPRTVEP